MWRLPVEEMYVSHMLLVRAKNGPGKDASGCHGEIRYAIVKTERDRKWIDANEAVVLSAISCKSAQRRKSR